MTRTNTTEKAEAQTAEIRAQHTPGPWSIKTIGTHAKAFGGCVEDKWQTQVALVTGERRTIEERAANARLIAAAPELLAIALKLKEHFEGGSANISFGALMDAPAPEDQTLWQAISAAIAKAEGRAD